MTCPAGRISHATTMPAVATEHYENFPVASWLCPPALRGAVLAIYHYARTADDMADEGHATTAERLVSLAHYRRALDQALAGQINLADWPDVFRPLAHAVDQHRLPVWLLHDLLDAFEQDTGNPRYPDRTALLDYCRRSANPIGRLMLHLAGVHDALSLAQSDAICSALQLINFWQDPSVDLPRGRHYVPEADARQHGLSLDTLAGQDDSAASQALLRDLCQWAAALMLQGAPLACRVTGRLGWELRLVVQGGLRILERIGRMRYCTLHQRPVLGPADAPVLAWRAMRMRVDRPAPGFHLP
jgi:squalene synthase HpnC